MARIPKTTAESLERGGSKAALDYAELFSPKDRTVEGISYATLCANHAGFDDAAWIEALSASGHTAQAEYLNLGASIGLFKHLSTWERLGAFLGAKKSAPHPVFSMPFHLDMAPLFDRLPAGLRLDADTASRWWSKIDTTRKDARDIESMADILIRMAEAGALESKAIDALGGPLSVQELAVALSDRYLPNGRTLTFNVSPQAFAESIRAQAQKAALQGDQDSNLDEPKRSPVRL